MFESISNLIKSQSNLNCSDFHWPTGNWNSIHAEVATIKCMLYISMAFTSYTTHCMLPFNGSNFFDMIDSTLNSQPVSIRRGQCAVVGFAFACFRLKKLFNLPPTWTRPPTARRVLLCRGTCRRLKQAAQNQQWRVPRRVLLIPTYPSAWSCFFSVFMQESLR